MTEHHSCSPEAEPDNEPKPDDRRGTISTDQLFGGRDEVLIRHGEDTYRLRITRTGKLILHK